MRPGPRSWAGGGEEPEMKDDDKKKKAQKEAGHLDEYAEWKEGGALDPRDSFRKVSNIALLMSYDLIDKLRWWEKETLALSDDQVAKRLPHTVALLEKLRTAYLDFADVDL